MATSEDISALVERYGDLAHFEIYLRLNFRFGGYTHQNALP